MKSRTTEAGAPVEAAPEQDPAIAAQIAQLREQWDHNGRIERVGRVAGGDPRYRYYWIATVSSIGDRRPISQAVLDAERDTLHLHSAKVDALLDLIEEQEGQPLLVAVAFKHEVERIRKALGEDVPYLGGGVSSTEANRIVDAWNRGEIPVLLAHPTSVAHGLNLQSGGNAMVWFGLTWSQEEHQQMIARIWRQGQTKPCVVHYIIADGTIDERVLQVLRDKTQNQNALLNALKEPTHA